MYTSTKHSNYCLMGLRRGALGADILRASLDFCRQEVTWSEGDMVRRSEAGDRKLKSIVMADI